jgi:Tol biopolymer transport system component
LAVAVVALISSSCVFVRRVTVDVAGGNPDASTVPDKLSFSADGRYVVFDSHASDLVANDGNNAKDVFVRDLLTGVTNRVSVDAAGEDANDFSSVASISDDGRYVAFMSLASDLGPSDDGLFEDVFVRDLQMSTTTKVSVAMDDGNGNDGNADAGSAPGAISGNGRYVSFRSLAGNLVADDGPPDPTGNGPADIFVRDLVTGTTEKVSGDLTGGLGESSGSFGSDVSDDGRYVAFSSWEGDLVADDDNGLSDIFLRDTMLDVTTRISVDTAGADPDSGSFLPAITPDGRYIAFTSSASDLEAFDSDTFTDAFVVDRLSNTTRRVSVDLSGDDANGHVRSNTSISNDGRHVAFLSNASDLVPGDSNAKADAFVRDLATATTRRVSVGAFGQQAFAEEPTIGISGNGQYVAFLGDDLTGQDGDDFIDVFVRYTRQPTVASVSPSSIAPGTTTMLTLTGTNFLPAATVHLGEGITVNSVEVVSESEIDVAVTVDSDAAEGNRLVVVNNHGSGPGADAAGVNVCATCLHVT